MSTDHAEQVRQSYREQGAIAERERILKIIADYRNKPSFGYANLISLIKGEQKS